MTSLSRRDAVLALLRSAGVELDDDDIADRLGMNRHYVNAVCRRLAGEGRIERRAGGAGKLVNSVPRQDASQPEHVQGDVASSTTPPRRHLRREDRARGNVDALVSSFDSCLRQFEESNAFPGPSLYFHERALERRRSHDNAAALVDDELFMEYVYAVLPAWGMHRMGNQRAKVGDFTEMCASFRRALPRIEALWDTHIVTVDRAIATDVGSTVWDVISTLRVSTSGTRIVAGSKALHHVLPDLVPPVDRQYTFRFFTGQTSVTFGEQRAFLEWFPYLCEIGRTRRHEIDEALDRGGFMATGPAKVIDNAIMGFMQLQGVDTTDPDR